MSTELQMTWERPLPFKKSADLPCFPVDELPALVGDYAMAVAETTQTSQDMAAAAGLAILALCIQGKFRIEGKPNWQEPLNLYTLVVAPPAERKSAVMALMSEPVKEFENAENERLAPLIERNQMEKQILQKRKKSLTSKLAQLPSNDDFTLQMLSEQLSKFRDIKPCQLFCDDITPEKLTGILSDNNGRAVLLSAEGGIFDMLAGRYSGSANIDVFLKAHAGDSIRVDRQGRESEYIANPAMTTLLFAQPNVIGSLMSNGTFQGRGLCARFLYSIPTSAVGQRKFGSRAIDEAVAARYRRMVHALLDYRPDEPRIITLSIEAYSALKVFAEKIEPMLVNELADIADFAGKLVGAVLRIAGLLYIGEQAPLYSDGELIVPEYTMLGAIDIGEYFLEHAKAAYQLMGADEGHRHAEYLLKRIGNTGKNKLSKRDLFDMCKGKFKTVEAMEQPLKVLSEMGYIREIDKSTGGRPTKILYVNPLMSG